MVGSVGGSFDATRRDAHPWWWAWAHMVLFSSARIDKIVIIVDR